MDESFIIPILYKGREYNFEAQLLTTGYTYKFQVLIDDSVILFERDDEGSFRALAAMPDDKRVQQLDVHLLHAIASKIEEILQ